jgi:hypothetical protein
MNKQIDEILESYFKGKIDLLEVRKQVIIYHNKKIKEEVTSAFSWVSGIGEQFFNPEKSNEEMVNEYFKYKINKK